MLPVVRKELKKYGVFGSVFFFIFCKEVRGRLQADLQDGTEMSTVKERDCVLILLVI